MLPSAHTQCGWKSNRGFFPHKFSYTMWKTKISANIHKNLTCREKQKYPKSCLIIFPCVAEKRWKTKYIVKLLLALLLKRIAQTCADPKKTAKVMIKGKRRKSNHSEGIGIVLIEAASVQHSVGESCSPAAADICRQRWALMCMFRSGWGGIRVYNSDSTFERLL